MALRETLRGSTVFKLVTTAARLRPADPTTAAGATRFALRELARRVQSLEAECKRLDALLESLVSATAPELVASYGVGTDTAGALLVSAGDNPQRLHSEAAFAHLCGVALIDASSGLTLRKRLNRGATAARTTRSGASSWCASSSTRAPVPTSPGAPRRAAPNARSSARSSATSPASSTAACLAPSPLDDR